MAVTIVLASTSSGPEISPHLFLRPFSYSQVREDGQGRTRGRNPSPPPRPRSRAGLLGGVTAGAAVLSYGVQVILDEGVDDESICRRSDGGDWKAADATSG